MPAEEAMTIGERRKYLKQMARRYRAGDRAARGALLTEIQAVTGLHRKSLIWLLGGDGRRGGRGPSSADGPTGRT